MCSVGVVVEHTTALQAPHSLLWICPKGEGSAGPWHYQCNISLQTEVYATLRPLCASCSHGRVGGRTHPTPIARRQDAIRPTTSSQPRLLRCMMMATTVIDALSSFCLFRNCRRAITKTTIRPCQSVICLRRACADGATDRRQCNRRSGELFSKANGQIICSTSVPECMVSSLLLKLGCSCDFITLELQSPSSAALHCDSRIQQPR